MKKILLNLILITTAFAGKSQNLVPNGDFELFTGCPDNYSEIDSAPPWRVPTNISSSDYYNQCATGTNVGVPVNIGTNGYQVAHSGEAYSGIYIFYEGTESREYIEVPLTSPLTANQCYYFEMYVNVYNGCKYTTSTMGAYLSDTLLYGINYYTALTTYTPQFNNTLGNMFDTLNWVLVSGTYTAIGGESFLTIGNFKDNANSDTLILNPTGLNACYIHVDDVSLTACTGIEEQNEGGIKIYPNPVKDYLKINAPLAGKEKAGIVITDILGKEILRKQINIQHSTLNLQSLKSGIYFIEINDGNNILRKKLLKE